MVLSECAAICNFLSSRARLHEKPVRRGPSSRWETTPMHRATHAGLFSVLLRRGKLPFGTGDVEVVAPFFDEAPVV